MRKIFAKSLDNFKNFPGLCISFHLVFWGLLAVSRASVLAAFFLGIGFKGSDVRSQNFSFLCLFKAANLSGYKVFELKKIIVQSNEQVDVIIYRVRESGLEVFLVDQESDGSLSAPFADEAAPERLAAHCIELDPVADANGDTRKAIAIEADWHEIPSLRALVYEDYRVAKEKAKLHIKHFVVDFEKGTYVAVKEAFKRVLPQQYAFLKELKEIIADKNQAKSI